MAEHNKIRVIITNKQKAVKIPTGIRMLVRRCCNAVLRLEKFEGSAEISVTFTDNEGIKALNKQYRDKDIETDVLSFPMFSTTLSSLLIVAPDPDSIRDSIDNYGADIQKLVTSKINTNDTWARDHAFITLLKEDATPLLLDFCFNGWGMKFAANYDNQINNELYFHHPVLKGEYVFCRNFILEGGSIESDGKGSLLTTEQCLLAKNRNEMNRQEVEDFLKETFNLKQVLWLKHGYLAGDDTDSHVDTLARFCPDDTIVYVKCTNEKDEHYKELAMMEEELKAFRTLDGRPYRLLPLPMASAVYDEEYHRLPATYANFLIMNEAVLYPTYADSVNDMRAKEVLAEAFPGREIVGIDCTALIKQHGSLHCVTMQYPEGVY